MSCYSGSFTSPARSPARTDPGPQVARREFVLQLVDGERVQADERYFLVRTGEPAVCRDGWTALEIEVMAEHRWWTLDELETTGATVWPLGLADVVRASVGGAARLN